MKKMLVLLFFCLSSGLLLVGCAEDEDGEYEYTSAWSGLGISADRAERHYMDTFQCGYLYFPNSVEFYAFIDTYTDGQVYQTSAGHGAYHTSTCQAHNAPEGDYY